MIQEKDYILITKGLQRLKLGSLKDYYQSEQWLRKKLEHRSKKTLFCHCCLSRKNLEMHHLTYERLGEEFHDDLVWLCMDCHEQVHLTYTVMLQTNPHFTLSEATNFWKEICNPSGAETVHTMPIKRQNWKKERKPSGEIVTTYPRLWRTNPALT